MEDLRICLTCRYAMPLDCKCNDPKCVAENSNKVECAFPLLENKKTINKLKTDCCINHKVK